MAGRVVLRAALLAAASACVAWFVLGAYQSRATARAKDLIAAPKISLAQARRARGLLNDAGTLNPDEGIEVLRSKLAETRGQLSLARMTASQAAHDEPLNPDAWLQYTEVSRGTPELRRAFGHLLTLVPPVSGSG